MRSPEEIAKEAWVCVEGDAETKAIAAIRAAQAEAFEESADLVEVGLVSLSDTIRVLRAKAKELRDGRTT